MQILTVAILLMALTLMSGCTKLRQFNRGKSMLLNPVSVLSGEDPSASTALMADP
jgi:hypothetical protein